ncbi:MAG: HisA/HisF-related TIM barrel protein [Methylocystis sp.]
MIIIPVIDIMGGVAVRAVGGRRDEYRLLATPLAASSDPCAVAEGFLRLHAFEIIYLADLDAIMGQRADDSALSRLAAAFPKVDFWLDRGGLAPPAAVNYRRVIGSESLSPTSPAPDLSRERNAILSLDFDAGGFRGPPQLERRPSLWPSRVIVMTLEKVGGGAGPDFARLAEIKARAGGRELYAAGGLRGAEDLASLAGLGIAGALVATALHEERIGLRELAAYA